ncbi:hypothetical protein EYF80_059470 [Liparis tanakae]|uniref:Uncharacterized protein n=1 Tax=Liparis tanakae TaxID=230148 RepID=A0A4Z2ENK7_9TELE|nr:hypothetical protein EYF80_059470 [Liparis tanakae]
MFGRALLFEYSPHFHSHAFDFPCPDGGPTRRTCNNPLQSSRISGPSESGPRSWASVAFISIAREVQ